MIELAGAIMANQVYNHYSWSCRIKYDENGVNHEFEEFLEEKFNEFYTNSSDKVYKAVSYEHLKMLIKPYLKKYN